MTSNLSCEALRDDLIALLYDDGEVEERSRARDHLAQCTPCRLEYSEFKGVRKVLVGWSLPSIPPIRETRFSARWLPVGLAAAAGLVLGIGVALAGRNSFLPNSTEPQTTAASAVSNLGSAPDARTAQFVSYDQLQELLKTQESRHQDEIADLRRAINQFSESSVSQGAVTNAQPSGTKTAVHLSPSTIEKLLKASEERQARAIEARLSGLRTENDLQRQYDMAQIAAGLAYIDSRTGADAARTSELMKNLVRVTAKPQDR